MPQWPAGCSKFFFVYLWSAWLAVFRDYRMSSFKIAWILLKTGNVAMLVYILPMLRRSVLTFLTDKYSDGRTQNKCLWQRKQINISCLQYTEVMRSVNIVCNEFRVWNTEVQDSKSSSKERWRWETEWNETPSWITQTDRGISFQDGITSAPDDSHVGLQKRTITVRLSETEALNPGRVFPLFLLMVVFKF